MSEWERTIKFNKYSNTQNSLDKKKKRKKKEKVVSSIYFLSTHTKISLRHNRTHVKKMGLMYFSSLTVCGYYYIIVVFIIKIPIAIVWITRKYNEFNNSI